MKFSFVFFLPIVLRKLHLTFHANCLLRRQFPWNVKSFFLRTIGKKIINIWSAEFIQKVLKAEALRNELPVSLCTHTFFKSLRVLQLPRYIEGWAQDWRKSDGCFSPNLISSPWRHNEDYNISFCKQWKFRCHCSYEQWHLNLHCLQRGPSCP